MLYLDASAPDAVEKVIQYIEWRARALEVDATRATTKRDQLKYATASAAMGGAAKDLRAATENAKMLAERAA